MAPTFKAWQRFVANPKLTRKFTSEVVFTTVGICISGTYFRSEAEYDALNMQSKFPGNQDYKTIEFKDW